MLEKLQPTAKDIAEHTPAGSSRTRTEYKQCESTCRVEYTPDHHEVIMWYICILLVEYTAGLLLDKADKGHCYVNKPCKDSAKMHVQMVSDFVAAIDKLSTDIKTDIGKVKTKWSIP
jgi:hypothetical protein